MTVIKHKDMTWKEYLAELKSNKIKISPIEKVEFSGFLLKRDLEKDKDADYIVSNDDFYTLAKLLTNYMIAESAESTKELLDQIKKTVVNHYESEIHELLN